MPPSKLKNEFAIRRIKIGLTQAELARRAGCSPPSIRAIERNLLRPSKSLLTRINLVLDGFSLEEAIELNEWL